MPAQGELRREEEELGLPAARKPKTSFIVWLVVVIWMVLGWLGLLTSIVCFAYDGTYVENWMGLVIAATLFGPFYWLYFAFAPKNYCSTVRGATSSAVNSVVSATKSLLSPPSKKKSAPRGRGRGGKK